MGVKGFAVSVALLLMTEAASAQGLPPDTYQTHRRWAVVDNAPPLKGKRVYRRYVLKRESLPNVMMLHCPVEPQSYVHLSLELRALKDMQSAFPSGFEPSTHVRVLAGNFSFTLPAELIKTELFFDRTDESKGRFDKLLAADSLTIAFGTAFAERLTLITDEKSRKVLRSY